MPRVRWATADIFISRPRRLLIWRRYDFSVELPPQGLLFEVLRQHLKPIVTEHNRQCSASHRIPSEWDLIFFLWQRLIIELWGRLGGPDVALALIDYPISERVLDFYAIVNSRLHHRPSGQLFFDTRARAPAAAEATSAETALATRATPDKPAGRDKAAREAAIAAALTVAAQRGFLPDQANAKNWGDLEVWVRQECGVAPGTRGYSKRKIQEVLARLPR
jgi:hypothetical protein